MTDKERIENLQRENHTLRERNKHLMDVVKYLINECYEKGKDNDTAANND